MALIMVEIVTMVDTV